MIETTADPTIICSAVHLSKRITQKDTNILLQKKIKERVVKFLKIYSSKNINVSRSQTAKKTK